jgi:magnesium-protoporphyrin IX monomethyl ester (oxidative) cyclase
MKVCLINPPVLLPKDWKGIVRVFQPIGLAYIAAFLEKNGYEVVILDTFVEGWKKTHDKDGKKYCGMSYEDITKKIKEISPEIVGIMSLSAHAQSSYWTAEAVKNADKNIVVVFGGPHASVRPKDCLSNENIDFVVIGEGEYTFLELVKTIEKNATGLLKNIDGIGFKENNEAMINKKRESIKNLDELPFPARHLLPMEKYFEAGKSLQTSRVTPKRSTTVITSRGCPFNCIFCSVNLTMGRMWMARSPENVVAEVKQVINDYGIEEIMFEDDNMSFDKKRMEAICDLIINEKIKFSWYAPNGLRADTLDENLLRKMKDAGCKEIYVAPESGDQEVVNKIVGKNLDLKKVEEIVAMCKKVGIDVGCFFVIGMPGETKENIKRTIEFARKLRSIGAKSCSFFVANPFYGTRLYNISREKGYLTRNDGKEIEEGFLNLDAMIKTPEFSPEEICMIREQAMGEQGLSMMMDRVKSFSGLKFFLIAAARSPKYTFKYIYRMRHSIFRKK